MSILCVCLIHGARRRKSIRPTKLIPNAPQKKKIQSSDTAPPYFCSVNSAHRTENLRAGTQKGDGLFDSWTCTRRVVPRTLRHGTPPANISVAFQIQVMTPGRSLGSFAFPG